MPSAVAHQHPRDNILDMNIQVLSSRRERLSWIPELPTVHRNMHITIFITTESIIIILFLRRRWKGIFLKIHPIIWLANSKSHRRHSSPHLQSWLGLGWGPTPLPPNQSLNWEYLIRSHRFEKRGWNFDFAQETDLKQQVLPKEGSLYSNTPYSVVVRRSIWVWVAFWR